jgi:hypothetical protein
VGRLGSALLMTEGLGDGAFRVVSFVFDVFDFLFLFLS